MVTTYQLYIDGEWTRPQRDDYLPVINPATGRTIARVSNASAKDVGKAVDSALDAFKKGPWPRTTPANRSRIIWRVADLLEKESARFAAMETANQGKPIKLSEHADLPLGIDNIRFYAGALRNLEGKAAAEYSSLGTSFARREPLGVVACITPWNYPLLMAIWKIIPAIAAGNTVIAKPATVTPLTTLEFAELMEKAGLPKGVVNVVTGPGVSVGEALLKSNKVDMVAFTGDTATGRRIMESSSGTVKRLQLELGGKAPFIVFEDADLDAATEGAVVGGYINSGQDCTAATRLYVHKSIYRRFIERLVTKIRRVRLGDPTDPATDNGPLISEAQRTKVEEMVATGRKEGARLSIGGNRPDMKDHLRKGFYYEPTLFSDCKQDMKIVQKEIFGPVLTAMPFSTFNEAIEKANDVEYGLACSVWTKDVRQAMDAAVRLRFGEVWINDHLPLVSEMPHGGLKQSGFGKDLGSYSFEEYTVVKHVYVDLTGQARKPWHHTVYGES